MTFISYAGGAPRPHRLAPMRAIRGWFAAERQGRRAHHAHQELARLPDHLLRDIGLERLTTGHAPDAMPFGGSTLKDRQ
ncbi:DUF1127 domain-containing protein [Jannaschia sp. KMU-145]|uniref:DUF1127 domain-containing protein n=1 Tax=Jannaschia halovivens TaxID=3388667 RepID=UPI00396B079C